MCNPAVAAVISIAGSMFSARAQRRAASEQARMANESSMRQYEAAQDALKRGRRQEMLHRLRTGRLVSKQRAAAAASGIDTDFGSPLDIYAGTRLMGEVDAETIRLNAAKEAWGYEQQAYNYTQEARMARLRGRYGAQQSLITGGTQAAGIWASART